MRDGRLGQDDILLAYRKMAYRLVRHMYCIYKKRYNLTSRACMRTTRNSPRSAIETFVTNNKLVLLSAIYAFNTAVYVLFNGFIV